MRHFRTWALALLLVTTLYVSQSAAQTEQQALPYDAVCRIQSGDSLGSGFVYDISNGQVWVMTAKHVVANANAVACEFWRNGHQSLPVKGSVTWRHPQHDVAVIAINQTNFQGYLPNSFQLIPPSHRLAASQTIMSAGCANGSWATAWRGHILKIAADGEMEFTPPPANGRSGSPILDSSGQYVVGIVSARTVDNEMVGLGVTLEQIRRSSKSLSVRAGDAVPTASWVQSGGCENGQCRPGLLGNGGHITIGGGEGINIGRGIYPTMPGTVPVQPPAAQPPQIIYMTPPADPAPVLPNVPAAPVELNVDLAPIGDALKQNAEATTKLSDSMSKYFDAQTAQIQRGNAAGIQQNVGGIIADAQAGYAQGGVGGAVVDGLTGPAATQAAQAAALTFLPGPFGIIAYVIIGIALPFIGRFVGTWLVRKSTEVSSDYKAKKLAAPERTVFDDEEEERAKRYDAPVE